jgi:hypothetical protein
MTTTEQEPVTERLLTPAEVAGMLRVDPRTAASPDCARRAGSAGSASPTFAS